MNHLKVFIRYLKISWKDFTYFRGNFLFLIFYWIASLSFLLIFWKVIFTFLPKSLDGWTFEKLCVLNSFCYISWGFFTIFWGIHTIPDKVISGEIDQYLSRPISPLLGIIGKELHLKAIYEILSAILILIVLSYNFNLSFSFSQIIASFFILGLGTFLMILIHGCLSLSSFWWGKIEGVQSLIDQLDDFQKYPTSFYPKSIQQFLMTTIPLYFAGAFPTKILFGDQISYQSVALLIFLILFWSLFFKFLYTKCLKRYESHG